MRSPARASRAACRTCCFTARLRSRLADSAIARRYSSASNSSTWSRTFSRAGSRAPTGRSFVAASHSFAETGEFEEQLYDHLHALLSDRAGAAAEGVIRWHAPPFRALLSYEYEHAPVFFGRTRARNELRELLARQVERGSAFVLVFGASGSGKSSLVKAGLLPDLALPGMIGRVGLVRRAVFRPSDAGGDPLAALAAAILSPTALPELAGLHLFSRTTCSAVARGAGAGGVADPSGSRRGRQGGRI